MHKLHPSCQAKKRGPNYPVALCVSYKTFGPPDLDAAASMPLGFVIGVLVLVHQNELLTFTAIDVDVSFPHLAEEMPALIEDSHFTAI